MDVDQAMKASKLAAELRKHGFASNSQEAFAQAQTIATGTSGQATVLQSQQADGQDDAYLAGKQTELLVQMHTRKLQDQFHQLLQHVQRLADEVVTLKGELATYKDAHTQKVVQVVQEKQKVLPAQPAEAHPRSGNFKPSDVAIDKYFNFARK